MLIFAKYMYITAYETRKIAKTILTFVKKISLPSFEMLLLVNYFSEKLTIVTHICIALNLRSLHLKSKKFSIPCSRNYTHNLFKQLIKVKSINFYFYETVSTHIFSSKRVFSNMYILRA